MQLSREQVAARLLDFFWDLGQQPELKLFCWGRLYLSLFFISFFIFWLPLPRLPRINQRQFLHRFFSPMLTESASSGHARRILMSGLFSLYWYTTLQHHQLGVEQFNNVQSGWMMDGQSGASAVYSSISSDAVSLLEAVLCVTDWYWMELH